MSGSRGQVRSWLVLRMSIRTESLRFASLDYLVNLRSVFKLHEGIVQLCCYAMYLIWRHCPDSLFISVVYDAPL